MGINIPIIPGLKPLTTKKQLSVLPRIFHVDIPTELSNAVMKCKTDADVELVGTEWLSAKQGIKAIWCACVTLLHFG